MTEKVIHVATYQTTLSLSPVGTNRGVSVVLIGREIGVPGENPGFTCLPK